MPSIKFIDVLSYSNEDINYPAKNLLKPDSYLKWKCEKGSNEKNHNVILKLDKLASIHSIDIGNEHSAFVEVLVGREGTDYQVLLVASSFMTPLESRNSTNVNRVRMFGPDMLNKNIANQKWDRIKVICTQPFNKNIQHGLSFIHLHGEDEKSSFNILEQCSKNVSETKLGRFTLKEGDTDNGSISVGSLFAKRKEVESPVSPAAIRAASSAALLSSPKAQTEIVKPVKRKPSLDSDRDTTSSTIEKKAKLIDNSIRQKKNVDEPKVAKSPVEKIQKQKSLPSITSKPSLPAVQSKPFNKLMNGVVFVMSGYQNPKRSQLRDKMLAMGAKYKGDWDKTCTHLICAYTNTPKFSAVKGKGKIVNEKWIEDSHNKKIRIPWRRYNLEKNNGADESEDEIWATELLPQKEEHSQKSKVTNTDSDSSHTDETDDMGESIDTDNEIENALNMEKSKNSGTINGKNKYGDNDNISEDDYEADTDIDEEKPVERKDTASLTLPPLFDFFKGKTFFLYGDMGKAKQRSIERYIIAYGGKVVSYMNKSINFVITEESWDDNFDDALNNNPSLQFVKPHWIWQCCNKQKCIPPQPFLVSCIDV